MLAAAVLQRLLAGEFGAAVNADWIRRIVFRARGVLDHRNEIGRNMHYKNVSPLSRVRQAAYGAGVNRFGAFRLIFSAVHIGKSGAINDDISAVRACSMSAGWVMSHSGKSKARVMYPAAFNADVKSEPNMPRPPKTAMDLIALLVLVDVAVFIVAMTLRFISASVAAGSPAC